MLFNLIRNYHKFIKLTPPNANITKKKVIEYPFCKIIIGFLSIDFELGSRVPLIDAIPIAITIKSIEWMTMKNKMKLDASIEQHMVEALVASLNTTKC